MKRILAAVDTSDMSGRVVEEAAKLAQLSGAEVNVLHVMSDEEASVMLEMHAKQETKHAHDWMQPEEKAVRVAEEAAAALKKAGVQHKAFGAVGDGRQVILDFSKEHNADVIVVGFQGLHGLGKVRALGSVSRGVLEDADCPVLIVPSLK